MKPCNQCGEDIPNAAALCSKCKSYQDWRGKVLFSQNVLALLVALASVLAFAIPNIAKVLEDDDSKVVISEALVRGETIYIIAMNLGKRPGMIQRAGLLDGDGETIGLLEPLSATDTFIRPGAHQVTFKVGLDLSVEETMRLIKKADSTTDEEKSPPLVMAFVKQASGQVELQEIAITNSQLRDMLLTRANRCVQSLKTKTSADGCDSIALPAQEKATALSR